MAMPRELGVVGTAAHVHRHGSRWRLDPVGHYERTPRLIKYTSLPGRRQTYRLSISARSERVAGYSFPINSDDRCIAASSKLINILLRSILVTRQQTDCQCLSVTSVWVAPLASCGVLYSMCPASVTKRHQSLLNGSQPCSGVV
jgi:hypothetical protein